MRKILWNNRLMRLSECHQINQSVMVNSCADLSGMTIRFGDCEETTKTESVGQLLVTVVPVPKGITAVRQQ